MKTFVVLALYLALTVLAKLDDNDLERAKEILEKELFGRELELTLEKLQLPQQKRSAKTTAAPPTTAAIAPPEKTKNHVGTTAEEAAVEKYQHVDSCFDVYGKKKCQFLINDPGWSCEKARMKELCERSCGYCGHPNVDDTCSSSKYGCCENHKSISKADPVGSNCPGCKDTVPELCTAYEKDCNAIGMVGEWMRTNCVETCHMCKKPVAAPKKNCHDDEKHSLYCPFWKEEGLCRQIPILMKKHCKKTCGLC